MMADLSISLPAWLREKVNHNADWFSKSWAMEARILFAVDLSKWNVELGGGGPFGAAIFNENTGELVALGVNRVEQCQDPTAHAEIVAIRMATQRLGQFNLAQSASSCTYALYSSAEPCCMCTGAILWSGIKHLYFAADRDAVEATGFDEGPLTPRAALTTRGVTFTHMPGQDGVWAAAATEVLAKYHRDGGLIYNGV
jgi:tRNA(Arg) A34 adenosine deaminase TadA